MERFWRQRAARSEFEQLAARTSMISERKIYVHIQLPGTLKVVPAGLLTLKELPDGLKLGTFGYGRKYLDRKDKISLDPEQLPLDGNVREFTKLKGLPGSIRDSSPDAWGRRVIEHQLEVRPDDLVEADYLLHGPKDGAGWLLFSESAKEIHPGARFNLTHQLEYLIQASQAIQERSATTPLSLMGLEPGTSMGGARPKATIEDGNKLWLAKFPEREDEFNYQRVEFATLELAARCGLLVTKRRLITLDGADVLMLERFDREYAGEGYHRLGLVSSLTVLDAEDNHLDRALWSYPLFAEKLRRWSVQSKQDSIEIYRRMVFNACITNNDDHPRNHALLGDYDGWKLSPAYDLVPKPLVSKELRDLALTVGKYGRAASLYNLISSSETFGLSREAAEHEIKQIVDVCKNWPKIFAESGVSQKDIQYIEGAFLPESLFRADAPEPIYIPLTGRRG
ncbi:type II toxin-antitoxin system HipA family toxin [Xanthomonas campestris]|uniref:type II toxin-antitoxin system HipA family toxin n=1 Tax=Xanthomonas campestris TaxID=339 RepID=UPI001EE856DB|nr:HipA domain-containing protein [Xanthomonas campestris]